MKRRAKPDVYEKYWNDILEKSEKRIMRDKIPKAFKNTNEIIIHELEYDLLDDVLEFPIKGIKISLN